MASVTFDRVEKTFPDGTRAVDDLSLEIADGEFMVLVGPSGCGKTTALRLVAGLDDLSGGEIRIGGDAVQDLPPRRRDVAMVFQSYALYPHMNVFQNMAFALRSRRVPKPEIRPRVESAAKVLDLGELLRRRPGQLSGGQRQRVAMGRAIVREPHAFLMDEPLSNLDANLRVQMRAEISRLQRELDATTIYVTHDQVEAMTMGDRVAVMRRGRLQQCAAPQELYDHPANLFVASFIGSPSMNFVQADVVDAGTVRVGDSTLVLQSAGALASRAGTSIALGIRPEHLRRGQSDSPLRLRARVVLTESLGPAMLAHVELRGRAVRTSETIEAVAAGDESVLATHDDDTVKAIASLESDDPARIGDTVELALDPRRVHLFDLETGEALRS
ncbi:MAG TPA: sn-glycerol-3-phosphate ABC transporter ATP-binding protein UgpC [Gaiellaceae bacterium]|nr:sn-glycerol-3-phosphate ABC transporter ATP-binding protein UgpC [Gaiellaceae bacterium]